MLVNTQLTVAIEKYYGSQWVPSTVWLPTYLKREIVTEKETVLERHEEYFPLYCIRSIDESEPYASQ